MTAHPGRREDWEIEPPEELPIPTKASLVPLERDNDHAIDVALSRMLTPFEVDFVETELRSLELGSMGVQRASIRYYDVNPEKIAAHAEQIKDAVKRGAILAEAERQRIITEVQRAKDAEVARLDALRQRVAEIEF